MLISYLSSHLNEAVTHVVACACCSCSITDVCALILNEEELLSQWEGALFLRRVGRLHEL